MENNNQYSYGDLKISAWRCPECETVNTGDQCYVCLQPRPAVEEMKMCTCGYRNNKNAVYCAKCGRRWDGTGINWKLIICAVLVIIVLALTVKNMLPKLSDAGTQYTESPTISTVSTVSVQETVAEDAWKDNVLMKDRAMEVIPLGGYKSSVMMNTVLGSELMRGEICRVVFQDTVQNVPEAYWDVSESQNNSVLAWVVPAENNLYELFIAAEGGINGKLACEDLFCGYGNVISIDFNNCFHTEETEDFSRMFYGCWQLEKLDLTGIKTDRAINLSEMFANCYYLTEVDVSLFDTSNVENTSGMFSNCWALQNVDIMSFDLIPVRDISYMFYQCPAGDGLQMILDGFWFKNVDRYECFMDEGVLVNGKPWIALFEVEEVSENLLAEVIRERLPIIAYAMNPFNRVDGYEDSALTKQVEGYCFRPAIDEIVITNISDDGLVLEVRYPSTKSATGYDTHWFSIDDIIAISEIDIYSELADKKTTTFKWSPKGEMTAHYGSMDKGNNYTVLGTDKFGNKVVIYSIYDKTLYGLHVGDKLAIVE